MTRSFTPKVVTANLLLEGHSVWLTEDDRWSRDIREAELIEDEAIAQIRLLDAAARASEVVGPYLADAVRESSQGPGPVHFREVFRTTGPAAYTTGKGNKHV